MSVPSPRPPRHPRPRRAVTVVELLVVVGAIAILAAVLLAALAAVRGTGEMTDSLSRVRQIGIWMQVYSGDNREVMLPSRFDYRSHPYPGTVRSEDNPPQPAVNSSDWKHRGTWTDILWTINELGPVRKDAAVNAYTYRYDSPDRHAYEEVLGTDWDGNPLRASAPNSRNTADSTTDSEAKPFDTDPEQGAYEAGLPGFFAANDFFDSTSGTWWTTGQIRAPDRSLYLIDSFAGETISPIPEAFAIEPLPDAISPEPPQVDFRYSGEFCVILFLDGHQEQTNRFDTLEELEGRGVRVRALDRR